MFDYLRQDSVGDLEKMLDEFADVNYTKEQLQIAKIKFINDHSF